MSFANLEFKLTGNDTSLKKSFASAQENIRKTRTQFSNLSTDGNRSNNVLSKLGLTALSSAIKIGTLITAAKFLGDALSKTIQPAIDSIEILNKFNVALGSTAVATGSTVDSLSALYGLDKTNMQDAISTFALLGKSMGMSDEQSETLGTSLYQLGLDLSSLHNVPINQVMSDLRAGLVGQSETVYKYGMDVTEVGLKAVAAAYGITKSVREMSQGEKAALRYIQMLHGGSLATGDFARTFNAPANQIRVLTERLTTLSRSIGSIFLNALGTILPYLNAFVSLLIDAANAIATFFGFENTGYQNMTTGISNLKEDTDSLGDSLDSSNSSAKKLAKTLLSIDEIHALNSATSSASSGSGTGSSGNILDSFVLPDYSILDLSIYDKSKQIKENLIAAFEEFGGYLSTFYDTYFAPIFDPIVKNFTSFIFPTITSGFLNTLPDSAEIFKQATDLFLSVFEGVRSTIAQKMPDIISTFNEGFVGVFGIASDAITNYQALVSEVLQTLQKAWDDYGKNTFGNVIDLALSILDSINTIINNNIRPVIDDFFKWFNKFYKDHIEGLVLKIANFVDKLVAFFLAIYNKVGKPLVDMISTYILPVVTNLFGSIGDLLGDLIGLVIDQVSMGLDSMSNILDFVTKLINGDIPGAGKALEKFFTDFAANMKKFGDGILKIYNDIKNLLVQIGATLISVFSSNIYNAGSAINNVIDVINKISFSVPDWVPVIGGKQFKPNITRINLTNLMPNLTNLPKFKDGGIALSSTIGQFGEAGTEAVIPLSANSLKKYFSPIIGNNIDEGLIENAFYSAIKRADSEKDNEVIINNYIDGVYNNSSKQTNRKIIRAGRMVSAIE